jgi:hypothetical protein
MIKSPVVGLNRPLRALLTLILLLPAVGLAPLPARPVSAETTTFPSASRRLFGGFAFSESVASGDLDADGDLDIVVARYGQSAVYLNDGQGHYFAESGCEQTSLVRCFGAAEIVTTSIAVGDLDGDGDLDIAAIVIAPAAEDIRQGQFMIAIYINDAGHFAATPDHTLPFADSHLIYAASGEPTGDRRIALGDLNGDGRLDIVAGGADPLDVGGARSVIYLNGPTGFPAAPSATFAPAINLALGDLDGDGRLDIVAGSAHPLSNIRDDSAIYLNSPAGFSETPSASFDPALSVALGDLDGDGRLDLAVADPRGTSRVYMNRGLQNGALALAEPVAFGPVNEDFRSLALGDTNGDGLLDIVIGSGTSTGLGNQNAVLLNQGGGAFAGGPIDCAQRYTVCFGTGFDLTTSVALGDIDGDGALDIVVGNDGGDDAEQSAVYLGSGGGSFAPAYQELDPANPGVWRLALGDIDGDTDLDVVFINRSEGVPNGVFINNGDGHFALSTAYLLPDSNARSLALGDLNGDGWLDLVIGNRSSEGLDGYFTVYLNTGRGGFVPAGDYPTAIHAASMALGDIDGDGDLDLVIGNSSITVYWNTGSGQFQPGPEVANPIGDYAQALALGDLDSDGDLDIATANNYGPNLTYINDGQGRFTIGAAFGRRGGANGGTVALGDLDGDNDLDIVVGGYLGTVFYNDGAGQFPTTRTLDAGGGVRLGDIDGDGDLDVLIFSAVGRSAVYLNTGAGAFPNAAARSLIDPAGVLTDAAIGDIDGDGDLDIVAGSTTGPLTAEVSRGVVYLNGQQGGRGLPNNPPTVRVDQPGPTPAANFYATAAILASPVITISYSLADPEGDPVRAVRVEYSLDGGGHWRAALPTAETVTTNVAAPPGGRRYSFGWDTFASGFFGQSDNVVVRVLALPAFGTQPHGTPDAAQRPYVAAGSFPFRARGSQVQVVNSAGEGQSGALVTRRAHGQSGVGVLLAGPDGAPFSTDANGYLRGRGTLALSDTLVALLPVLPTATNRYSDSYTLYHTNMLPTEQGVAGFTVEGPGVQRIDVAPTSPLALFHLDVALEWDARYDRTFMAQLEHDLRRTSEFLFDATNGQAALGDINIWHAKENWDSAHLRIYASNRLRPNAVIGGVAGEAFTHPITRENNQGSLRFGPGQVHMGAVWNRFGNQSDDSLSEDWPRTLTHELGHYLLFLDDNYLGFDDRQQIIPIDSCSGLMGDPYASLELRPAADWLPDCARTFSHATYGRSDWETLTDFYPELSAPTVTFDSRLAGPATLPLEITTVLWNDPLTPTVRLDVPIFYTTDPDGRRYLPGPQASAFLFQNGSDATPDSDRITNLGRASNDQILARGARVGDRICLFAPLELRLGCETIRDADETITITQQPDWRPNLIVTPVNSRTLDIELQTLDAAGAITALSNVDQVTVRLYPNDEQVAPPALVLSATGDDSGVYRGRLILDAPVISGYLHLVAGPGLELVDSFALAGDVSVATSGGRIRSGGGRIRSGGGRIRSGGGRIRSGNAPLASAEGDALLVSDDREFGAGQLLLLQSAGVLPPPPPWATPLGQGYRFTTSVDVPDFTGSSISLRYRGAEVPIGEEQGIRIYYFADAATGWVLLPTTLDTYHNLASAPKRGAGIYALMSSRMAPPLVPGWNLLAYPGARRPVAEALAAIDGKYTTVYGYTPTDPADPWRVYAAGLPAEWQSIVNDLTELAPGQSYWLRMTEAIQAPLFGGGPGALPASSVTTMLTLPPATYYGIALNPPDSGPVTVQAWVGEQICGQATARAARIAGQPQLAFVIDVQAAGGLSGCGTPGATVRFVLLQQGRAFAATTAAWNNATVNPVGAVGRQVLFLPLLRR